MAIEQIQCTFDPMLVKSKCIWEAVRFFFFWKIVNKQLKIVNKFSKIEETATSQTHFGFTNIRSDTFRVTAIWSCNFWFGSPCILKNLQMIKPICYDAKCEILFFKPTNNFLLNPLPPQSSVMPRQLQMLSEMSAILVISTTLLPNTQHS